MGNNMNTKVFTSIALAVVAASTFAAKIDPVANFGGPSSWATGISADGSAVYGQRTNTSNVRSAAYWWTSGAFFASYPSGFGDIARHGNNNASFMVGDTSYNGKTQMTYWNRSAGTYEAKGGPTGYTNCYGFGVSDNGAIVSGWAMGSGWQRAYRWTNGTYTFLGLGAIGTSSKAANVSGDGLYIGGTIQDANLREHPVTWGSNGNPTFLEMPAMYNGGRVNAMSHNNNWVVGAMRKQDGFFRAARWSRAFRYDTLNLIPGETNSEALGVSPNGNEIAGSYVTNNTTKAFIFDMYYGKRDLRDALIAQGVNMTGWNLIQATGVVRQGTNLIIVGNAMYNGQTTGFRAELQSVAPTLQRINVASYQIESGMYLSGSISSLWANDGNSLNIINDENEAEGAVIFRTNIGRAGAMENGFEAEYSSIREDQSVIVSMKNVETGQHEQVLSSGVTMAGNTFEWYLNTYNFPYIAPNGDMEAKVQFIPFNDLDSGDGWSNSIDLFKFLVK